MNTLQTPLEKFLHLANTRPHDLYFHQPLGAGRVLKISYSEAQNEVLKMAAYLKSLQLPPRSKIAILSKNCAHWIISDLAIMLSGHISVPLYPNTNAETVQYVLEHSESKVLFVGKLDSWDSLKPGVPNHILQVAYPHYGPYDTSLKKWADVTAQFNVDSIDLKDFNSIQLDELLTIIYTSGTTGNPKGVMLKCRALAFSVENALTQLNFGNIQHRQFSYLPLSHIAERAFVEMSSLWLGAEVHFAESIDTFVSNLQESKPTLFIGVPRIWTKFQMGILAKLPQNKLDLLLSIPIVSSLVKGKILKGLGLQSAVFCFSGAAPISEHLMKWFQKLGINILEVYAMTENCAYSHFYRPGKARLGSVGQAMPYVQVKQDSSGQIISKSPANMEGYYKDPDQTAETLKDGWLYTGDTGVIDSEGFLKITGRVKEIFKTDKGKYVAPSPIEMKLSKNQNIEQVCVAGSSLPNPIALVVPSQEARALNKTTLQGLLEETLVEVNETLESHEKLKCIVVLKDEWTVENNMLTPSMKIKRRMVESKYSASFQTWFNSESTVLIEG